MDTMAFVEKFLQTHGYEYERNLEDRSFKCDFEGKFGDILVVIACPEIDEERGVLFDEVCTYAMLDYDVSEDKATEVVALITHI